jgi:hypothetical protein
MPYRASRLERAYRIAPIKVQLVNDAGGLDDVTLNVRFHPLSLNKLDEWEVIEARHPSAPGVVVPDSEESEEQRATREQREREEEKRQKTILAFQLSDDVVFDLDLVEEDNLTPKKVTYDYLLTLDLGFLKDIKREIEDRAFPEKKELRQAMLQSLSRSGT